MARLSKVEACMICEQVPCSCGQKPKPVRQKTQSQAKQAPATDSVDRAGGASMRDKMKAAAVAAPVSAPAGTVSKARGLDTPKPPQPPPSPDADTVLAVAIRNLAPILHPEELQNYSAIVTSVPSAKDRAAFWRAGQEVADV